MVLVNDDCSLTYLPARVIPVAEVPAPPSGYASRSIRGALHGSEGSTRSAVDPDYHIVNKVQDKIGLVMTYLQTDLTWTENGSVITSGSGNNTARWHPEDFCGLNTGWKLEVLTGGQSGAGVGSPYATWSGHAEWSYKGFFSGCNPTTYYNIFDNSVTGTAGGIPPECSFAQSFRNTFSGWRMIVFCYDPLVTKKDVTIP